MKLTRTFFQGGGWMSVGTKNAGWQKKKVGDVIQLISGQHIDAKDYNNEGRGVGYLTGPSDFGLINPIVSKWTEHPKIRASKGDILLTVKGSGVGKINRLDQDDVAISRQLMAVRVTGADPQFIYAFLTSAFDHFQTESTGAAIPGISREQVLELEIAVPPINEQQRIVRILDEAFEGIAAAKANAEKNLQNARALFESHLQSVFTQRGPGWKMKTLEEIATSFGRGKSRHRPRNEPKLYGGKYPFIQTGDIRNADHYITEYTQTYSELGLSQSKLWPKGTICITIAANIAETAILGFDACFPDSVIGVVANPKEADIGFIEYLLQFFKASIQEMGKGSAQANINMGTFENERFPFPPVGEQKRIVIELEALQSEVRRLTAIYERKLVALDNLKKALLAQAFSGKLVVSVSESITLPSLTLVPNITTTDLHAGILAMSYQLHVVQSKERDFGHVKAEKVAHMVEAYLGIELGRQPVKDAAGPNDYKHLKKVEHRAKMAGYFNFVRSKGEAGYHVVKYAKFNELIEKTTQALGERKAEVESLLLRMLNMDWRQAEIFATVYAAWNNLLLDCQPITDERIVYESREQWHPDKMKIERERFFKAIQWMRKEGLEPTGKGKRVVDKT